MSPRVWSPILAVVLVLSFVAPAFACDAWVAWVWILHPEDRHGHWTLWNAYVDQAMCQRVLRAKRDGLREDGYTISNDDIDLNSLLGARAPDGTVALYRCLPAGSVPR